MKAKTDKLGRVMVAYSKRLERDNKVKIATLEGVLEDYKKTISMISMSPDLLKRLLKHQDFIEAKLKEVEK